MRLWTFAKSLERLEATRSRLATVKLVAELLSGAGAESVEAVVNLLQGQLRPPYEGVEVGVGAKLLIRVLVEPYGASAAAVTRHYRKAGDLGLVAERLAPAGSRTVLTVAQAYRAMLDAARATGPASIEHKIGLLAALLCRATSTEAKYLVRVLEGRLRLGVGDQTILEATAVGALGDGRKKPVVEHAYNARSDLGGMVRLAFTGVERALRRRLPSPAAPRLVVSTDAHAVPELGFMQWGVDQARRAWAEKEQVSGTSGAGGPRAPAARSS